VVVQRAQIGKKALLAAIRGFPLDAIEEKQALPFQQKQEERERKWPQECYAEASW
jgi:hypothetical protein